MTPADALADLTARGFSGWSVAPGGAAIAKSFRFSDFDAAFAWMTQVAEAARAADHHPDWRNLYATVEVVLTTHDAGAVTVKDLALAASMEAAFGSSGGRSSAAP